MNGHYGDDFISGGKGNDKVVGGNGDDWIKGGDDNDTLFPGEGNDLVRGGKGDDIVYYNSGFDIIGGGEGYDICNLSSKMNEELNRYVYFANGNHLVIHSIDKNEFVHIRNFEEIRIGPKYPGFIAENGIVLQQKENGKTASKFYELRTKNGELSEINAGWPLKVISQEKAVGVLSKEKIRGLYQFFKPQRTKDIKYHDNWKMFASTKIYFKEENNSNFKNITNDDWEKILKDSFANSANSTSTNPAAFKVILNYNGTNSSYEFNMSF